MKESEESRVGKWWGEYHDRSRIVCLRTTVDYFDYLDSPSHWMSCQTYKVFVTQDLPTLNLLAKILKGFIGQPFGEIVGKLFFGVNLFDLDVSATYGMPKVMPLDIKVLGARHDLLVHCKSAILILEDGALN
jgi:hypothetical protein